MQILAMSGHANEGKTTVTKFFANRSAIDEINNIQAANTWKLLLHILQKNYNF